MSSLNFHFHKTDPFHYSLSIHVHTPITTHAPFLSSPIPFSFPSLHFLLFLPQLLLTLFFLPISTLSPIFLPAFFLVLEFFLFLLLLHLLPNHHEHTTYRILYAYRLCSHILYIHISGTIKLSALVEVTVYLTQPFFSYKGWLSVARPVSSLLCLKALWTLWSAASGPGGLTEGQTATKYPREELQ